MLKASMSRIWSIPEAKAKLSEVLRRAKAGERQVIGTQDQFVVLPLAEFDELQRKVGETHLGRWLVDHAPKGNEIEAPTRSRGRPSPFDEA